MNSQQSQFANVCHERSLQLRTRLVGRLKPALSRLALSRQLTRLLVLVMLKIVISFRCASAQMVPDRSARKLAGVNNLMDLGPAIYWENQLITTPELTDGDLVGEWTSEDPWQRNDRLVIEFSSPINIGSILFVSSDVPKVQLKVKVGSSSSIHQSKFLKHVTSDGIHNIPYYGAQYIFLRLNQDNNEGNPLTFREIMLFEEIDLGRWQTEPVTTISTFYDFSHGNLSPILGETPKHTVTPFVVYKSDGSDPSLPLNPSITFTFPILTAVSHVLITNHDGYEYDIEVSDGSPCSMIGGNTVTTDVIKFIECNSSEASASITITNIGDPIDMSFNKIVILGDTCGFNALNFYYPIGYPWVTELEYENLDQLEVRLPYVDVEVVPNCYTFDYTTSALFKQYELVTSFQSTVISLDLDAKEIVIQNSDISYIGTESPYFGARTNDPFQTIQNPPARYHITFVNSCLINTILPFSEVPRITYVQDANKNGGPMTEMIVNSDDQVSLDKSAGGYCGQVTYTTQTIVSSTTGGPASTITFTPSATSGMTDISIQPPSIEVIGMEIIIVTVELIDPHGLAPTLQIDQTFEVEFVCAENPAASTFSDNIAPNWEYNPFNFLNMCYTLPSLTTYPVGCFSVTDIQVWQTDIGYQPAYVTVEPYNLQMLLDVNANMSESGAFMAKYVLSNDDEITSNRFQINFSISGLSTINGLPPQECLDCTQHTGIEVTGPSLSSEYPNFTFDVSTGSLVGVPIPQTHFFLQSYTVTPATCPWTVTSSDLIASSALTSGSLVAVWLDGTIQVDMYVYDKINAGMTVIYELVITIDDGTQETLDTFKVKYVDSCWQTSIIDQNVPVLQATLGVQSSTDYNFFDNTVQQSVYEYDPTNQDPSRFICGFYEYNFIVPNLNNELSIFYDPDLPSTFTIQVQNVDTSDPTYYEHIGTSFPQLEIRLQDYPSVSFIKTIELDLACPLAHPIAQVVQAMPSTTITHDLSAQEPQMYHLPKLSFSPNESMCSYIPYDCHMHWDSGSSKNSENYDIYYVHEGYSIIDIHWQHKELALTTFTDAEVYCYFDGNEEQVPITFDVSWTDSCLDTQIVSQAFEPMVIKVGQTLTQTFTDFQDTQQIEGFNCGSKAYTLNTTHNFLSLSYNITSQEYELTLTSTSETEVNSYIAVMEVHLVEYTSDPRIVDPLYVSFSVIIETGVNLPPQFDEPLSNFFPQQIERTYELEQWKFELPSVTDFEDQHVDIQADLSNVESFMLFDDVRRELIINDLSDNAIESGFYSIVITLDDGENEVVETIIIDVRDAPPLEEPMPELEEESELEESPGTENSDESPIAEMSETTLAQDETDQSVFDWRTAFIDLEQTRQSNGQQGAEEAPIPHLSIIEQTGRVIISFSQDMHQIPNLAMLQNGTVQINGDELPVFKVEIIAGDDSDPEKLNFTWSIYEMTDRQIAIQMFFKEAVFVSANQEPDLLRLTFIDKWMFVGKNNLPIEIQQSHRHLQSSSEFLSIERAMPTQIQLDGTQAQAKAAADAAVDTSKLFIFGNFLFNLLISASLNQLWALINTQQLIVLMPLFKINLPANAGIFFNQIMQIAAFDIIEISEPLDDLLDLEPTDPINENFEAVGFESIYLLNNMGTLAIAYLIWIVATILTLVIWVLSYNSNKTRAVYHVLRKKLFFNSIISLFLESYSLISVCCLINFSFISFETYGIAFHSITCILFFTCMILMPILLVKHLLRFFERLDDKMMISRYGSLYDELDLRVGKIALVQPFFFLLRRLMLAFAIVIFNQALIWQIMLMSSQIVTSVIIVGNLKPFNSQFKRKIEFFNECILMMVMYTIICFSPLVNSVEVKFQIGYISMLTVSMHLVVNFGIIGKSTCRKVKFMIFLKHAKRKHVTQRKELQTILKTKHNIRKEYLIKRRIIVEEIIANIAHDDDFLIKTDVNNSDHLSVTQVAIRGDSANADVKRVNHANRQVFPETFDIEATNIPTVLSKENDSESQLCFDLKLKPMKKQKTEKFNLHAEIIEKMERQQSVVDKKYKELKLETKLLLEKLKSNQQSAEGVCESSLVLSQDLLSGQSSIRGEFIARSPLRVVKLTPLQRIEATPEHECPNDQSLNFSQTTTHYLNQMLKLSNEQKDFNLKIKEAHEHQKDELDDIDHAASGFNPAFDLSPGRSEKADSALRMNIIRDLKVPNHNVQNSDPDNSKHSNRGKSNSNIKDEEDTEKQPPKKKRSKRIRKKVDYSLMIDQFSPSVPLATDEGQLEEQKYELERHYVTKKNQ